MFDSAHATMALHGAFRTYRFDEVVVIFDALGVDIDSAWVPWRWYRWSWPPPQA
jgi:hypothetical protein